MRGFRSRLIFTICAFIIFFIVGCKESQKEKFSIDFPKNSKIDTLNLIYSEGTGIFIDTYLSSTGKVHPLGFDTGADRTVINNKIRGIKIGKQYNGWDINGDSFPLDETEMDTLKIGNIKFYHGRSYRSFPFEYLNGLLGGDLFKNFVWKIDFAAHQMYVAKQIEAFEVNEKDGLPLNFRGNTPVLQCAINGKSLSFAVDFGYSGAIALNTRYADSLKIQPDRSISWFGKLGTTSPFNNNRDTIPIQARSFMGNISLGDKLVKGELVNVGSFKSNLLGLDFFSRFDHVILDYINGNIYLGKQHYKSTYFREQISSDINSMGIKISSENPPKISAISSDLKEQNIGFNDTVIALNGEKIYGRALPFYMPETTNQKATIYNDGISIDTVLQVRKVSKLKRILSNFYNKQDTATVTIKRGDSHSDIHLVRNYHYTSMPDTLQSFEWSMSHFDKNNYKKLYTLRDTIGKVVRERYIYIANNAENQ